MLMMADMPQTEAGPVESLLGQVTGNLHPLNFTENIFNGLK